jgi:Crinkler effector protein N-terminal domain
MSQDELCELWCLMEGETSPFFVTAGVNWKMERLKKAIKKEKRDLRDLDTSYIVLWKVRIP